MKHYRDSFWLKVLNVLAEYTLIMLAYWLSGYLRQMVPLSLANNFSISDMPPFIIFPMIGTLVAVMVYFILGSYSTIHYRSITGELSQVFTVQILEGCLVSALLFWLKGGQFSRVWLAIFIAVSISFIMAKRVFFHIASDIVLEKKLDKDRILVVGGGDLARRYMEGVRNNKKYRYELIGYAAQEKMGIDEKYIGNIESVNVFLQNNRVNMLVISEEDVTQDVFRQILAISGIYDIRDYVIPMFNDYQSGFVRQNYREDVPGIQLFPVKIMNTDNILGVNIAVTNMEKTISDIAEHIESWRGEYICVSNVHTTVMAHDNEDYRQVQNDAVMALPDGGPLSAHSRMYGNNMAQRVTGPDLMREILKKSDKTKWRHFFYGSSQKTIDRLRQVIQERYPDVEIAGMISPPFRQLTLEEDAAYVEEINNAKPDFVWVGLGAPKQEIWMAAHRKRINAIMIGVGAAFDYESGNIKRAPMWMQKASLEWLYRLMQDPKRLFRRYFVTNFKYLWLTRK